MISNREAKFIKSLQLKKFRTIEQKFVVEGGKNILELLTSDLDIDGLLVTQVFLDANHDKLSTAQYDIVKQPDLERMGSLKTNNAGLAVVHTPTHCALDLQSGITLAFDRINDPGNLGTIIRIADWYGIDQVVCSKESVDCFSPKVVSATMGSFARVKVYYEEMQLLLTSGVTTYATTLDGAHVHDVKANLPAIIFFGSEAHGLDPDIINKSDQKVTIPGYGRAESLNVAVSTAIFCDNFVRLTKT